MSGDSRRRAPSRRAVLLKRGLLGFWAVYLALVLTTNVLDGLKALDLLGTDWAFASGNFAFLVQTTSRYSPPAWLNGVLFLGVLCWEGLAALLFGLAAWSFRGRARPGAGVAFTAFVAGLSLWAGFVIAEEIFIAYPVEAVHWRLFTALLATLLAVELLPEEHRDEPPTG
jgi:hypothetical protein